MDICFIHQNFPGQYQHIASVLAKAKSIRLTSLSIENPKDKVSNTIHCFRYGIQRGNAKSIHPWALDSETKMIRGEACARAAHQLQQQGYQPDLICAHPGWGESLFLKQIWPKTPILHYQEFFYNTYNSDLDFDPELQSKQEWELKAKTPAKNASLLLSLEDSNWNVCPTYFQKSSFPEHWQQSISVIHDGINTDLAKPKTFNSVVQICENLSIQQGEPVITFVNRTLEPYRGCHSFIRSIPAIQRLCPKAKIVIVGETKGVSYGQACQKGEWKDRFLKDIEGQHDSSRIYFTGSLSYQKYLQLIQVSQAHVYLTYPFVLSWSLLEAMSTGCAVIGSNTAPVRELIKDGQNGLLVDFFDYEEIAQAVAKVIHDHELAETLGKNARATILKDYSLEQCVPRQIALMNMVACGALNRQ